MVTLAVARRRRCILSGGVVLSRLECLWHGALVMDKAVRTAPCIWAEWQPWRLDVCRPARAAHERVCNVARSLEVQGGGQWERKHGPQRNAESNTASQVSALLTSAYCSPCTRLCRWYYQQLFRHGPVARRDSVQLPVRLSWCLFEARFERSGHRFQSFVHNCASLYV